ncbi:MAG: 2TM domain-containing protein [Cyanobacteria bacterium P01_H01_bin.130]
MSSIDPAPQPSDLQPSDRPASELSLYDQEAVQEILQLALTRRSDIEGYSRSQLLEMGQELGLREEDIAAAEATWLEIHGDRDERTRFQASEKKRIRRQVTQWAIVTGFLIPMNWVLEHQLDWSLIVGLAWGLVVALDAWKSQQTDTAAFEKRFENWQNDQRTLDDWV